MTVFSGAIHQVAAIPYRVQRILMLGHQAYKADHYGLCLHHRRSLTLTQLHNQWQELVLSR